MPSRNPLPPRTSKWTVIVAALLMLYALLNVLAWIQELRHTIPT